MKIEDLLGRRSDLSTFLVHLTRDGGTTTTTARRRLFSILRDGRLRALNPFGCAHERLKRAGKQKEVATQHCVCFTETPLEHVVLLTNKIDDRRIQFAPYGIALTKKQGRRVGVNPVWYTDITPGHTWLMNSVDALVQHGIAQASGPATEILKLAPFIEQMGAGGKQTGGGYRKEFWWEREWRCQGDVYLPGRFILIAPSADHRGFYSLGAGRKRFVCIDANWSLEQIIATIAGFAPQDVGPM